MSVYVRRATEGETTETIEAAPGVIATAMRTARRARAARLS